MPQRSWRLNKSTSGLFPSIVTEFLSGFWLCLWVRLAAPNNQTLALDARRFSHPCLAAHGEAAVASVLEGRLSARQQLVVALARSILGGHAENSRHWISFDGY